MAVLRNRQGGDRDVGEEGDAEEWLVAGAALHAVCSHFQRGLPVAASLARIVTHDGHTDQLRVNVCVYMYVCVYECVCVCVCMCVCVYVAPP